MLEALLQDRVDFVALLLEHSYVNVDRFMKPRILRELYERGVRQELDHPGAGDNSFFQQLVTHKTRYESADAFKYVFQSDKEQLFHMIQYCEKKLFMRNWDSVYVRHMARYVGKFVFLNQGINKKLTVLFEEQHSFDLINKLSY